MFDMAAFIKDNLINGYQNGSFTREQVNIYALNYVMRGWLTQDDVSEIQAAISPTEVE
jgi:hypothetical protein